MDLWGVLGATTGDVGYDTAMQIRAETEDEAKAIALADGRVKRVEVRFCLLRGITGEAGIHYVGPWPTSRSTP